MFDDDLYIRSEKLKINNKTIQTPIKSFSMNNLRNDTQINEKVKGVNEIFGNMTKSKLENCVSGRDSNANFYKKVQTGLNKTSSKDINFCFISLPSIKLPEGKEIDVLTNASYINSDATPLPLVQGLFKEKKDFKVIMINLLIS